MKGPGQVNDFAKKAKKMKYNNMMDPKYRDVGSKTNIRPEKVDMVDSATGKVYGTRTIIQKTTERSLLASMLDVVLEDQKDVTLLPELLIRELKKNISAGARDLQQQWKNAIELVHKAYQVCNVRLPALDQKGAWKQYEALIKQGVIELSKARGLDSGWRITDTALREARETAEKPKENHIGNKRFFVDIPGAGTVEVDAKNMDEILDTVLNKMRRHGAVGRVEERTEEHATISVWVHGVKRDQFTIKHVS